jgi:cell wall-associated NlpC family hydrolase
MSAAPRPLDPRRHAFRADLAAESLRGQVAAARFTAGTPAQVARPLVPLRKAPVPAAALETEALFGEIVTVYDVAEGWAWVQLARDGYVGYLPADVLSGDIKPLTHKVKSIGTFVYAAPEIKSPPILHLSLGAELSIAETGERFSRLATGGYIFARHTAERGWRDRDFVEVAERLVYTPYLWGGRSRTGLDCSALVQLSLWACGIAAPRDSDMQRDELGENLLIPADLEGLQRGDLVFWPGHVGIMSDAIMLVHANAHHMSVVIEPLPEAAARIKGTGSEIIAIKRLPALTG